MRSQSNLDGPLRFDRSLPFQRPESGTPFGAHCTLTTSLLCLTHDVRIISLSKCPTLGFRSPRSTPTCQGPPVACCGPTALQISWRRFVQLSDVHKRLGCYSLRPPTNTRGHESRPLERSSAGGLSVSSRDLRSAVVRKRNAGPILPRQNISILPPGKRVPRPSSWLDWTCDGHSSS